MQQWAEVRRMHFVDEVPIKEIVRRTGLARNTVRAAIRSPRPPRYERGERGSKLDQFKPEIHRLLQADPKIPGKRVRELICELGYEGGKTICDDYLREVRPLFAPARTYQRTAYRPGELAQFDPFEPGCEIPVGFGQTRRGFVVTCCLGYSRAGAGALVFSKQWPDLAWGMSHCLAELGALPAKLVWDREGAIHAHQGRPTDEFAAFCGQLGVGWVILQPADPEAKGLLERRHRFMRTNFEPGRSFLSPDHYQAELDAWNRRVDQRTQRGIGAVPAKRLAEERERMRPLPEPMPNTDRRFVIRVPAQPYLRFDSNDYSLDPRLAGRRVEVQIGQREIAATALDSGELAARHRRYFARRLTFNDPAHQAQLEQLRGGRRPGSKIAVQRRPLDRYDALIPA